jgi:hypothetical protein
MARTEARGVIGHEYRLRSDKSIPDQFKSSPPEGAAALLSPRTVEPMRRVFIAEITPRFPKREVQQLGDVFDLAVLLHKGQTRRNGVDFIVHPWGTGILDLTQNDQITVPQLTVDLLHDVVEDCKKTPAGVRSLLLERDYDERDAGDIATGVFALSRKINGVEISQEHYLNNLAHLNGTIPRIRPVDRKAVDTTNNVWWDIDALLHPTKTTNLGKIEKFLDNKATPVYELAQIYEPDSTNTVTLGESMDYCRSLLPETSHVPMQRRQLP